MHSQNRPPTIPRAGFTLLELIGVMAVIAILAAAVLPGAIDLIRTQRAVTEGEVLPKIADALKRGMLREQVFPIYENDAYELTEGNDAYWWNLAARHGGGSANELRYPLGIRPGSEVTRKLYFAKESWSGKVFSEVTEDGLDWLNNFQDPTELRLLLVSTTNPDLLLPDTLNEPRFNKFWEDWSVGSDGDPASGAWSNYGFSSSEWQGRAAELNVQRIDLRDWLCTVVIENRRAIEEASGDELFIPALSGDWELDTVYAFTKNQVGSEIILQLKEVPDSSDPPVIYTQITNVVLTKRGRVTDEASLTTIEVRGNRIGTSSGSATVSIELTLTNRAPLALLNPDVPSTPIVITEWTNADPYIQNRYFLKSQELLLGEPWTSAEVGIFIITESFSTLRFDGLEWHY